jgi:hypothetical protein
MMCARKMTLASSVDDDGPSEGHVLTDRARLYYRAIGEGRPIIVLHGGPDFDHHYLLPAAGVIRVEFGFALNVPGEFVRMSVEQPSGNIGVYG